MSRFVYGSRLNVPDYMVKGGSIYRLITDHLGSVRLVVDTATGTVAQWAKYDEWGMVTADSGVGFQPFGFAWGLGDDQTTLARLGARDYAPLVGRWTSRDPIGMAAGDPNLFRYVSADPVNLLDPFGLCACDDARLKLAIQAGADIITTITGAKAALGVLRQAKLAARIGGSLFHRGVKVGWQGAVQAADVFGRQGRRDLWNRFLPNSAPDFRDFGEVLIADGVSAVSTGTVPGVKDWAFSLFQAFVPFSGTVLAIKDLMEACRN